MFWGIRKRGRQRRCSGSKSLQHVNSIWKWCTWEMRSNPAKIWHVSREMRLPHVLFTKASSETASGEGWLSGRWRKGWGHITQELDWRSVSAGLMRCWSQIWSISQKLKPANEDVIGWFLPHVLSQEITLTDSWPISTGSHISHHAFYMFSVSCSVPPSCVCFCRNSLLALEYNEQVETRLLIGRLLLLWDCCAELVQSSCLFIWLSSLVRRLPQQLLWPHTETCSAQLPKQVRHLTARPV